MLVPFPVSSTRGLVRRSALTWEAREADPNFRFRFRGRPRYIVLIVEGLDTKVEPVLYVDTGRGFQEDESIPFARAGRFVLCLELHRMPDLRAIRLDPMDGTGRVRLLALATPFGAVARWLMRRLARSAAPSGQTRLFTLASSAARSDDLGHGLSARRYRTTAEHYADVIAQQREAASPLSPIVFPLISFLVPTYETKPAYLDDLLRSFEAQAPLAELIFSDDGSRSPETLAWFRANGDRPRVRIILNAENRGIAAATNAALAKASGTWIALVDHDDGLSEGAVEQIIRALQRHPQTEFLYTDEVITDSELRPTNYFLKPAYDPVLLSGVNYINHLSLLRRARVQSIGGFRPGFDGSQDYDLVLRYLAGVPDERVVHLPYPAYLWRRHDESFSTAFSERAVARARSALAERYAEDGCPAAVEPALLPSLHRVRLRHPSGERPRVSVVIPNRDAPDLMDTVLRGLSETEYPDLEIVVVDNGSTDTRVFELYEVWRRSGLDLAVVEVPGPFNFSRSVNAGIARASGTLILLLNNDIEMREPDWLSEMVTCFAYPGTGIVGARLLYPDESLQHAGVIVGLGGLAGHWFCGRPEQTSGPMGRLTVRQSLSAVTGAVMLVSRECIEAVGPFDEEYFAIAYNDVDFCLRAGEAGFRTVWTPFATLTHHESRSRGSDEHPNRVARFEREKENLRTRHATREYCDPAYNPWYTIDRAVPGLRALDALPTPRAARPLVSSDRYVAPPVNAVGAE